MFEIVGITFHWYGIVVGLAIVVTVLLIEQKVKQRLPSLSSETFWELVTVGLVSGLAGARAWHVMTDFELYVNDPSSIIAIWLGGLSILGAITGGVLGVWAWLKIKGSAFETVTTNTASKHHFFVSLLDATVFGLPFGQAVGRLGNYVNQELYGLPTNLPWKIYIQPSSRAVGFEEFVHFHPLFAYEAVLTFSFGVFIWWWESRKRENVLWQLGSGNYFALYIAYYAVVRFGLDFLRVEKQLIPEIGLGVNQVVLLVVLLAIVWWRKSVVLKHLIN